MRCYTVDRGKVEFGIEVVKFKIANAEIDAIVIGESGRGRSLGVLPVEHAGGYPGKVGTPDQPHRHFTADVSTTRSGRPKLIDEISPTSEAVIVCFRTHTGFRGNNSHTGDFVMVPCENRGKNLYERYCSACKQEFPGEKEIDPATGGYLPMVHPESGEMRSFTVLHPEKCRILVTGETAQGDAGYAGHGCQHVAILQKGYVVRTAYGGRMYGNPGSHYYMWDGQNLLAATLEERELGDLF